ncbi:hypothetical protein FRC0421_02155 [Corynebacterium diphtheriae]|nr:hypothetical protein FRC0209_02200 [Corynebacterium diphtheriae]CAB0919020.1 hypothetical protein FRC0421_02155 [Corynebacterium diphtheriae]
MHIESDNTHPMILQEYTSVTNAVYMKPFLVRTYVMSATHSRLGARGLEFTIDQVWAKIRTLGLAVSTRAKKTAFTVIV